MTNHFINRSEREHSKDNTLDAEELHGRGKMEMHRKYLRAARFWKEVVVEG